MVGAHWLVAEGDRLIVMREQVGIHRNTVKVERVWQCCNRTLVQDLENEMTVRLTWTLVDVIDLNLDEAENFLTVPNHLATIILRLCQNLSARLGCSLEYIK